MIRAVIRPRLSASDSPIARRADGKVLYLIDCLFDNADVFMEQLRLWFAEHMPAVETQIIRPRESWVDDPEMRAKIVADGDVAIIGVGL